MNERKRYTSRTHASARFVAQQLMLKPLVWSVCNVKVHGKERLAGFDGPFIVVSNHSSHLDTPLIIGSLPQRLSRNLAVGAAADYFFDTWWRAVPTALFLNAFPIERGKGLRGRGAKTRGLAGHLLSDGVPLLIYPEGTRSRTKAMGRFKPGAASLCISRNVPCLPIALVGAGDAMPRGTNWPKNGRPKIHVVLGEPMWARQGETAHQFSDRIAARIAELHDETAAQKSLPLMSEHAQKALERETREGPTASAEPDPGAPTGDAGTTRTADSQTASDQEGDR
ncbi:lysophospholipid acyltransferase family protein [Mariniluteicoccus flavus]